MEEDHRSDAPRTLIAGCGYVGRALAGRLQAAGHTVWGLSRTPDGLPAGVRPFAADLTDPATLDGLPPRLDAVVYCAAAGGFSDERYRSLYVDGPRHLLAVLERQGQSPRRLLFTSSTGVYGQRDGSWVDEASPAEAEQFSGRRVRQGEKLFLGGPFPAVIARLGGIYGPGRTRLVDRVRRGEAMCHDGPPRWTNRIHRDDAAGAIAHLLALPAPQPIYDVVDREPADLCTVLRWIADRLGVEPPRTEPEDATDNRRRRSNKRVSCDRLTASGYTHLYPTFREGYAEMIADLEDS